MIIIAPQTAPDKKCSCCGNPLLDPAQGRRCGFCQLATGNPRRRCPDCGDRMDPSTPLGQVCESCEPHHARSEPLARRRAA